MGNRQQAIVKWTLELIASATSVELEVVSTADCRLPASNTGMLGC